jgi:hypothetical protein
MHAPLQIYFKDDVSVSCGLLKEEGSIYQIWASPEGNMDISDPKKSYIKSNITHIA